MAAYNLDRVRSFRAKQAVDRETPKPRAKRRRGTWTDVVDGGGVPTEKSGAPPG